MLGIELILMQRRNKTASMVLLAVKLALRDYQTGEAPLSGNSSFKEKLKENKIPKKIRSDFGI